MTIAAPSPDDEDTLYRLSYVLPSGIEEWVGENEAGGAAAPA
jgi:hypothetical protein